MGVFDNVLIKLDLIRYISDRVNNLKAMLK